MHTASGQFRVGTSGWVFPEWRGTFYPHGLKQQDWLSHYSRHFGTVEVNSTFYHMASAATFTRWGKTVPRDFLFSVKVDRLITHRKRLHDTGELLATFLDRARLLGKNLGPLLYQLPPHWGCNLERLHRFIELLPRDLTHVFEFRDPSWANDAARALLQNTGMNWCIHDMAGFDWPHWVTGQAVYVRFHGTGVAKYSGRYRLTELARWAQRLRLHALTGRDVFVYFNNDIQGHAVRNARELLNFLQPEPATAEGTQHGRAQSRREAAGH